MEFGGRLTCNLGVLTKSPVNIFNDYIFEIIGFHWSKCNVECAICLTLISKSAQARCAFSSMSYCGKWAWSLPDNATPSDFSAPKSWVSELSVEVSFVSVLAMVLSEYWKPLGSGNDCRTVYAFKKFISLQVLKLWLKIETKGCLIQNQTCERCSFMNTPIYCCGKWHRKRRACTFGWNNFL